MKSTKIKSDRELTYGEQVFLWRESGATPILDERAEHWTYILPGVSLAKGKVAELLAAAELSRGDIEPSKFREPEVVAVAPVRASVDYQIDSPADGDESSLALLETSDVDVRIPGLDLNKIDWGAAKPPKIPAGVWKKLGVEPDRLVQIWENFSSPTERRAFVQIWIQCAD